VVQPRSVSIPQKKAKPKKGAQGDGKPLSMGFGFVELPTKEEAVRALTTLTVCGSPRAQ